MRVVEVEVLDITLSDANISKLLNDSQHKTVATNIEIEAAQKELEALKVKEQIEQDKETAKAATAKFKRDLERTAAKEQVELLLAQVAIDLQKLSNEKEKAGKNEEIADFKKTRELGRAKMETDHTNAVDQAKLLLKKDELDSATEAAVKRFVAAKDGLYEVLVAMQRDELAVKLAEGCTIERYLSGDNAMSSIANLLSIAPSLGQFFEKAKEISGNGKNRLKEHTDPGKK